MSAGACDCHVHVVGSAEQFAQVPERPYTALPASLDSIRAVAAPVGVERFVIVQPSFYGNDNSCLLETLGKLGIRGRGVAVIATGNATPALFDDYFRSGVRGVRLNLYSTIAKAAEPEAINDAIRNWIDRLPRPNWHIEVIAPLRVLALAARTIAASAVPIVIDHYGLPVGVAPDSNDGRILTELAALSHVWIKLSGPYRVLLSDPMATRPPLAWLKALLTAAPERCVWGSDWPHTPPHEKQLAAGAPVPYRRLEYARVLGDFSSALPDAATARRVLVTNPMRLYGFPPDSDE